MGMGILTSLVVSTNTGGKASLLLRECESHGSSLGLFWYHSSREREEHLITASEGNPGYSSGVYWKHSASTSSGGENLSSLFGLFQHYIVGCTSQSLSMVEV